MLPTPRLRLAEITLIAILLATLLFAWRAERHDRTELKVELAAAQEALAAVDSRQHDRDAQLVQTLSTLAAQKRAVNTPEQILRALPQQILLPTPISLAPSSNSTESPGSRLANEDPVQSTDVTNRRVPRLGAIPITKNEEATSHAGN